MVLSCTGCASRASLSFSALSKPCCPLDGQGGQKVANIKLVASSTRVARPTLDGVLAKGTVGRSRYGLCAPRVRVGDTSR